MMLRKVLVWVMGALIVSAVAFAAGNATLMGNYYQNATNGSKVDVNGNAYVVESYPAMDANMTYQAIIQNTALAAGSADSSAILDTHRMRLGMLLFKITPGTGNPGITRLAVQVRCHLNGLSDSSSTFAVYLNGGKDTPAIGVGAVDTSNAGHQVTGSATAPWSGEFVVTANNNRNSPVNNVAATVFSYPNGIAVPLNNLFGREVWSPYTSVRVRVISGNTSAVTVSLVGTPL